MTWFTAASVSVNNGQNIVSINTTADDIGIVQEESMIFINGIGPGWVKRSYLDGSGDKKLELYTPWEFGSQTNQPAKVIWTDGGLARYARILQEVGEDSVTFTEAMAQIISSSEPLLNIETKTAGTIPVKPYGYLVQQVQELLATMGDFGVPLYDTDTKNQARTLLGLQPQLKAQPTIDLDFVNNEHKIYEQYGLTKKLLTEALTTVRASTATYNSPFGVATAAANLPRIEYDPATGECLGLICEEQRANLLLSSENFDVNWTKASGSTITTETVRAPNLSILSVNKYSLGTATFPQLTAAANSSVNAVHSFSIYIKAAGITFAQLRIRNQENIGSYVRAVFNLQTGSISSVGSFGGASSASAEVVKLNDGWYRCTVKGIGDSSGGLVGALVLLSTNEGGSVPTPETNLASDGFYVWGAQLEVGSFPTSYIPTTASQVTRASTANNVQNLMSLVEGTIFLDLIGTGNTGFNTAFGVGNIASEEIRIGYSANSGTNFKATLRANGVATTTSTNHDLNPGQTAKVALRYKKLDSGEVEFKMCFNGVADSVATTLSRLPTGFSDAFAIGRRRGNDNALFWNGHIRRFGYIPKALSDAELQELTRL